MKQWPQGLWIVAPDGKVLAHHYHRSKPGESYRDGQDRWVRDTVGMIEAGLAAAGTVPKRAAAKTDPLPGRGVGTAADGSVRLAVSVVGLRGSRREGPPAMDSIHLTSAEWATLAPPAGKTEWATSLPAFAPCLSPMTDVILVPRPGDVAKADVTATVIRSDAAVVVVRYRGTWEAAHNRDGDPKFPIRASATGEGVGVFDAATRRPRAMLWLLRGRYYNGPGWDTAAVAEWRAGY